MPVDPSTVGLVDLILHELRTPINIAVGSLKPLAGGIGPGSEAAVARAIRACDQIERLASEMRDWVRVQTGTHLPVATALAPALAEAIQRAETLRGGGVRVTLRGSDDDVQVQALPPSLADMLQPLLTAVLRAADDGAQVEVVVRTDASAAVAIDIGTVSGDADGFGAARLGGLGFSVPLAEALLRSAGGTARSTDDNGRLRGIALTLRRA
jgi:signal transduction histidine kinase